MENILVSILVFLLFRNFLQVAAFPKTATESFIIHYLEDRRIIPVKIVLNSNAQTEHVMSVAGETLYDFNLGKVAYKDLNSSQCFIMNIIEESIEKDRRRLKNLQNGVIRGFYMPTFIIHEELNNTYNFAENFGILLAEFCKGNTVSLVVKQAHRRKRDTSGDKGQFTHHSYGHYGHQSNNYAHYGHETRVSGSVDENGQIRNQRVNHQEIRSEGSHAYPRPVHGNGRQDSSRSVAGMTQRPASTNGWQDSATDSRPRTGIPQTQYQTQHRLPPYQQTFGDGVQIPNGDGTGQFSLQSSHEGGYQLNLPLGLQAGNAYRAGIRSGGHYSAGGLQPQIRTEYQQFPDITLPSGYQTFDQRQPLPTVAKSSYPSTLRGVSDGDTRRISIPIPPNMSVPVIPVGGDRSVSSPGGVQTSDTQIPLTTSDQRQHDIDYESQLRRQMEHRSAIPYAQKTPSPDDRSVLTHKSIHVPSNTSDMRLQVPGRQPQIGVPSIQRPTGTFQSSVGIPSRQPGIDTPSIEMPTRIIHSPMGVSGHQPGESSTHMPNGGIQSPMDVPGQISTIPSFDSSDRQRTTAVSRPSQIHGTFPGFVPGQQHIPGTSQRQQYLPTPDARQSTGLRTNGDIQIKSAPSSITPGIYSGYPSITHASKQETPSFPAASAIPSIPRTTVPVLPETFRNGASYPDATRPQTFIRDEYPGSGTYPGSSRVSIDNKNISDQTMRPGEAPLIPAANGQISQETIRSRVPIASRPSETIQDSRYNFRIPSRGVVSETSMPTDRGLPQGRTQFEASRIYGHNSASSQTQIQTGLEGTAAEASSAGQYGGLGSQTQVQGGYVGNGSFSAQAQSGFTGGVVQSQVRGGKQGGLSGSSAEVERVGSAQSQVQVLQPSGSATSTAQGRFTGGTTQVQAQSSKTGGSAEAQAQSTGLSSSHVQVNVGGNDVRKDESFQGTVSASVHGDQLSGQSQTQMQGGYDSGRTYAATAQGGFDTSLGFQAAIRPVGSLTNVSSRTLGGQQIISTTDQETSGTVRRDQSRMSGGPISRESTGIPQQAFMPPVSQMGELTGPYPSSQTDYSRIPYPTSIQDPSRLPPSHFIQRNAYPGYPTDLRDSRFPTRPHDFPGYRGFDERGAVIPGYLQERKPEFSEQQTYFNGQVPKTQDRVLHESGSQRQTYPSLPVRTDATDQDYISRTPYTYPQITDRYYPSQPSASIDSRYAPRFPSIPQQPGFPEQLGVPSRYLPPSHVPDQSQNLPVNSQRIIPSQRRTDELPILTRPDGSQYVEQTHYRLPMPDVTNIQPEQPQLLYPSSQVQPSQSRPQIQTQYPAVSVPRPQVQPHQTSIAQPRPQVRPEQPQISPSKPQISTTTESIPVTILSGTTEVKQDRTPGVSEPDKNGCCATLRDLKRRCCGEPSKQDATSPCCRSSRDDIFDFSSEDDLDEDKEPCKVVKAICYIVYKPVGKARVCKPTATTLC